MTAIPPEVRDLAKGIAADIRKYGHYQSRLHQTLSWCGDGQCCVMANPTLAVHPDWRFAARQLALALGHPNRPFAVWWNDTTSTADVLAALDRIAEGGRG